MTAIVPLQGAASGLLERICNVRAMGDVPLVVDDRLAKRGSSSIHSLIATATLPAETAWATLTSGSSGAPRIVLRTDASWSSSYPAVSALLGARATDGIALPAPLSSSLTLFSVAHSAGGGPHPLLNIPSTDGQAAVCFHGTPQGLRALLRAEEGTTVRTALVGGSHLEEELRADAESRGIRVVSYYGAAELSFVAYDTGAGLRPFPGVEIDIREGELWVRSPFVALGYLGQEGPFKRDGQWATVGDLADVTDDTIRLRGRKDDAILTASATVIPQEIEAALRLLPGVADAVTFGLPAAGIGALVAAWIEPEESAVNLPALRRAAADQLTTASRPRVWFIGQLPRTPSGKPARAEAVRRALAGEVARLVG